MLSSDHSILNVLDNVDSPVVQDVVYELHSDRLVLPVYTYIPGFGWGEPYGDIVTD